MLRRRHAFTIAALLLGLGAPTVHAQQPLEQFVHAADDAALDVREARAGLRQARAQVDASRARLLPSFFAQGAYTRNQFEAGFANPLSGEQVTIQPFDSFTATFQLTVPIVDIGAWSSFFQSEASADATEASVEQAEIAVSSSVVQVWHQLVASRALITAAERNLEVVTHSREQAAARVEVGVASPLELSRAEAEVARAEQSLAEARLQETLTARNLQNLTGMRPDATERTLVVDLDRVLPPLQTFAARADDRPAVRAARARRRAADIADDTAWTAFLPTITASATESGSNVGGFTGQNFAYAISIAMVWRLDFALPAQIDAASANAELAAVRAERASQQVETGIFEAWHRVETARVSARSAQAAAAASARAAQDVRASFDAGAATQLDLIQAERDRFRADVALIQAYANLRVARMVLALQVGEPLEG